ncbi:MAG: nucleotidyltransferase domain-containing protein [Thermoprotei archaeon]
MSLELEEREFFRFYDLAMNKRLEILEYLKHYLEKYSEIVFVIVFGSFTQNTSFRDIDLALYLSKRVDYLEYKLYLDKTLSDLIKYPIDTHILNNAPPWFVKIVCLAGKVLFTRALDIPIKVCKMAIENEEGIVIKTGKL